MIEGWIIVALALAYVGGLFVIAWIGDHYVTPERGRGRPLIYALSIGAYCSSWTFFGSVGLAASTGYDFLPTYLGPGLLFVFGWRLIRRIVRIAKKQNITSIADFMAARYGKSPSVAALVTVVAVVATLPYIALQLTAVSMSVETLLGSTASWRLNLPFDTAFVVAIAMAAFAILFGTRHVDATEHQDGLMLAIAAESVVKLMAFLTVGVFVLIGVFGGPASFVTSVFDNADLSRIFAKGPNSSTWITVTVLSFIAVLLLPRQFHTIVVENKSEHEIRRARWLFPLYLIAINLFVVPIAAAGLVTLPKGSFSPDTFVLALPLTAGANVITMFAFIGGLSAATAMVIIDSVAIAIMVCNGVVVPLLLRRNFAGDRLTQGETRLGEARSGEARTPSSSSASVAQLVLPLLAIRRCAIFAILMGGYAVYHVLGQGRGLVSIGLVSFAAIAQLGPAFFGGLFWRRATARGALWGITAGIAVWAYTLVLPWLVDGGMVPRSLLTDGPFGLAFLKPEALFYLPFAPLSNGVFFSLLVNCIGYIVGSLSRQPRAVERTQADAFALNDAPSPTINTPTSRLWASTISIGDLKATVARYLGTERTERSFADFAERRHVKLTPDAEADATALRFAEHLLASAVGAASSRLILSLRLRRSMSGPSALRLLDDASEALLHNRDLLQSAMDQVRHGLGVFDKEMKLISWNRQFRDILRLPPDMRRVGVPLDQMLRRSAERGDFGPGAVEDHVSRRVMKLAVTRETYEEFVVGGRQVIEVASNPMPQGGIVVTLLDITERYAAAAELSRANASLEQRVEARTLELRQAIAAVDVARLKADEANLDKTRFLAAASHDVMQPLNAARLYMSSLIERNLPPTEAQIAHNIDASLEGVEEILSTLIDIARLDAGRMAPDITPVSLGGLFEKLSIEFAPMAARKALTLHVVKTDIWVVSDRRLLRRLLQNLVSNAIKYTARGTVVLSARDNGGTVTVSIADTGPGIPNEKLAVVFKEFQRLDETASSVRGLGLGLAIVERVARMLGHPVGVRSTVGRGSTFTLELPVTASRIAEAGPAVPGYAAPAAGLSALSGLVVLCVDNEQAVLDGMETLLAGWGCTVLKAASIEDAVRVVNLNGAARGGMPDIILADYHLDRGTGLDAIAAVRLTLKHEVPSVIITAETAPEIHLQVREQSNAMLRKPIKAAQLRAVVTQLTRQRVAAE